MADKLRYCYVKPLQGFMQTSMYRCVLGQ